MSVRLSRKTSRVASTGRSPLRLGLCCTFAEQPIKFGTTTATAVKKMPRELALAKLAGLCRANALALMAALQYCHQAGIGAFRINSQILPLKTHPEVGYEMAELPQGDLIVALFRECGDFARANNVRTSFHPDQFVVLNSPRPEVVASSILELEYQAEVAEWVGADVVNIHAGGAYGNKAAALAEWARNAQRLSDRVRSRLTLENDDVTYTPTDLLRLCSSENVPLVYDVHHHRCAPDGLSVEAATAASVATWNREPMFHISSPLEGWGGPRPERHHDYIDITDFPSCWLSLHLTVEVEAKAKELALSRLQSDLRRSP